MKVDKDHILLLAYQLYPAFTQRGLCLCHNISQFSPFSPCIRASGQIACLDSIIMENNVPHLNWIPCMYYNAKSPASHCNRLSLQASLVSLGLWVLQVKDAASAFVKKKKSPSEYIQHRMNESLCFSRNYLDRQVKPMGLLGAKCC